MSGSVIEAERKSLDALGCPNFPGEAEFIKCINRYVKKGGDIDVIIYPETSEEYSKGIPILLQAIKCGYVDIVRVLLEKGASIQVESWIYLIGSYESEHRTLNERPWNALELATIISRHKLHLKDDPMKKIYELVKEKSMEKFSSYGLHRVHLDSAIYGRYDELEIYLAKDPSLANRSINLDSPLWPGYTPLLIAAKFWNRRNAYTLLGFGANSKVKDTKGNNTPLHFMLPLHCVQVSCDYKLYVYEEADTLIPNILGDFNGMTPFHIACYCGDTNIVKRYLELGVSPDLGVKNKNVDYLKYRIRCDKTTGLHMSAQWVNWQTPDPDLAKLLLEYGAKVDAKDAEGNTPLQKCRCDLWPNHREDTKLAEVVCVLLESGASAEFASNLDKFVEWLRWKEREQCMFLQCLKRMEILRKDLITDRLKGYYDQVLQTTENFDQVQYENKCKQELDRLEELGLRRELEDRASVSRSFKRKFESFVGSSALATEYPIYGELLKIKLRRRSIELEKKVKAIPYVRFLFEEFGKLPELCAEIILRSLDTTELDTFLKIFVK